MINNNTKKTNMQNMQDSKDENKPSKQLNFFSKLLSLFLNANLYYVAILFLGLYFIPGEKYQIYDLMENKITPEFTIYKSTSEIIFAPFVDLADYFIRFENLQFQPISWLMWTLIAGLLIYLIKKKSPIIILKLFILFWFLVIFVLFFKYPGNMIKSNNPNKILVNYHSHTYYSWDGMASPKRSLEYHKANGFDAYAITEHNLILSEKIDPKIFNKPNHPIVIFGQEIRDNHIFKLIYNNKITCAALWWEHLNFENTIKQPMDTYEISNMGHRLFNKNEYDLALKYAKTNNIPIVGTTDWHGWGYRANTWTALDIPNWNNLNYQEKQTAILDGLKGKYKINVLQHTRYNELKNNFRYTFEPFFGLFYLLTSKNSLNLLSWFIWVSLITFFIKFLTKKRLEYLFWLISGASILIFAIKTFLVWQTINGYNKSLKDVSIYLAIIGIISLIISFLSRNNQEITLKYHKKGAILN